MSTMRIAIRPALWGLLLVISGAGPVSALLAPQGGEYAIARALPGDQSHPHLAANASGGILVWQDNATDGDGLGISAQLLNSNFAPKLSSFRVNSIGAGDQENPQVALLKNGGAAIVWQGGRPGFQKVFARFLSATNTFVGEDLQVNSYTSEFQIEPVVASLPDGSVLVAWSSFGQDGSLQGIFARRLSPTGAKLGDEFQVNQFTEFNQRSPAMATLNNGNVLIVWVSEQQTGFLRVDIFARLFKPTGEPITDEFLVNTGTNVCANPAVSGSVNGGFTIAWSQKDVLVASNSWDVFARAFGASGTPLGDDLRVNTYTYGDQFAPKIASLGTATMVVWTSLLQDGSFEGVFGQFLDPTGQKDGAELRVNTTTLSRQIHPTIASDGAGHLINVWSSYVVGALNFDLFAQQYSSAPSLPKPAPPFVSALDSHSLSVTWPPVAGYAMDHYELLMDNGTTPTLVTNDQWTASNLAVSSTHSFRLLYQLSDGSRSPWSDAATGTTWGTMRNDGVPFDWLIQYWGNDPANWPAASADSDGDGASNLQEFLAGTNPLDPGSALRMSLSSSSQGWRLNWNTQPGFIYQVQSSGDLGRWVNLGLPRFAPGASDSIPVDGAHGVSYYRVVRVR